MSDITKCDWVICALKRHFVFVFSIKCYFSSSFYLICIWPCMVSCVCKIIDVLCVHAKLYAVPLESILIMIIFHAWYTKLFCFSFSRVSNCVHYFVFFCVQSPRHCMLFAKSLCFLDIYEAIKYSYSATLVLRHWLNDVSRSESLSLYYEVKATEFENTHWWHYCDSLIT